MSYLSLSGKWTRFSECSTSHQHGTHPRDFSLKPEKDSELTSFRSVSLLATSGKLFVKIPLTRILSEISGRWFLRNEQFGFGPKHSTALQLVRLVERVPRNFEEKRLIGAVFPVVVKAFNTVCVYGLLHKLTFLNFLSYLVKTISSYLHGRMLAVSSKHTHLLVVACGLAWIREEWFFPSYSIWMSTTCLRLPATSRVLYTDDKAIITSSSQPALIVNYLETYLSDIWRWLGDWRITCVSSSTVMLFAKTRMRISKHRFCCSSGRKSIVSILPVI